MKVKELITKLQALDENLEVFLQTDPEGNAYYHSCDVDQNAVYCENDWGISVYTATWTADEADMCEDDWEHLKLTQKCVVIFP